MVGKHTEVFYGKKYTHYHDLLDFDKKSNALKHAKYLRSKGFNIKIVKRKKKDGRAYWAIYFRKRT